MRIRRIFQIQPVVLFVVSNLFAVSGQAAIEQYQVLPHRPETFYHLSVTEGPAFVTSTNSSFGNRFKIAADIRFGEDSRFDFGWTLFDVLSSGEHSGSVGDITRYGSGPNIGYFILPDRMWIMYVFDFNEVDGSRVSEGVTSYAHQLEIGYQFYSSRTITLGAALSYLYAPRVSVPVFDLNSNNVQNAVYPSAQIWSLSLALGCDFF